MTDWLTLHEVIGSTAPHWALNVTHIDWTAEEVRREANAIIDWLIEHHGNDYLIPKDKVQRICGQYFDSGDIYGLCIADPEDHPDEWDGHEYGNRWIAENTDD